MLYWLAFRIFGQNPLSIHIFMNLYTIPSAIVLYLLTTLMFNKRTGIFAALILLILTMSPTVFGQSANTEIFMTLPIISAVYFLFIGSMNNKTSYFFAAGLCLGAAYLIKQAAVFYIFCFLLISLLAILFEQNKWRNFFAYIAGTVIPVVIIVVFYFYIGSLQELYYDTVSFAVEFAKQLNSSLQQIIHSLIPPIINILKENIILIIFAVIGIRTLYKKTFADIENYRTISFSSIYKGNKAQLYLFLWTIAAAGAISGGYRFYPHYFIFIMSPLSIIIGLGLNTSIERTEHLQFARSNLLQATLLVCILSSPFIISRHYWLTDPDQKSRLLYSAANPFPEAIDIAEYIKNRTNRNDKIFILGSEPEILFLSQRQSVTKYAIVYPLTMPGENGYLRQQVAVAGIDKEKPKYILYVNSPTSLLRNKNTNPYIFNYLARLTEKEYFLDGLVIINNNPSLTQFIFGEKEVKLKLKDPNFQYTAKTNFIISLYRRI